jgi:hypothetical protein
MADCFGEFGCGYFLSACEFGIGLGEPAHRVGIPHDGQGLFQPLQVLDGDQHGGRAAVDSDPKLGACRMVIIVGREGPCVAGC